MTYSATIDPVEAAMNPQTPERSYFGQITTDWFFCVLERGAGKVVFDALKHGPDQKHVAINVTLMPLVSDRVPNPNPISRDVVDFEKEWTSVTLPSLKALAVDLRTVKGQWAHIKLVKTSEYTAKDGTVKDKTAIKLVELFPSQAACEAARDALFKTGASAPTPPPSQPTSPAPPVTANEPIVGIDRKTATLILPGLWSAAGQKPDVFLQRIAAVPDIARYFDANSPEVRAYTDTAAF